MYHKNRPFEYIGFESLLILSSSCSYENVDSVIVVFCKGRLLSKKASGDATKSSWILSRFPDSSLNLLLYWTPRAYFFFKLWSITWTPVGGAGRFSSLVLLPAIFLIAENMLNWRVDGSQIWRMSLDRRWRGNWDVATSDTIDYVITNQLLQVWSAASLACSQIR